MNLEIPGYTIVRELGRGGSATVYLAVQESLNRRVALKVLHSAMTNDPLFGERFKREGRIIAKLNHPHIVPVYDVGEYNSAYYMAMEYLSGSDLKQQKQRLSLQQLIDCLTQVLSALDFAHHRGYVHRDVKAENILFRAENDAVLTDFGIARQTESLTHMTVTGAMLGTPAYMSPEQVDGKPLDGRSDLYSIGIMLYEMLSGHLPYRGESMLSLGLKHMTMDIPNLPNAVKVFQPIINKLLAKQPRQRFNNASECIAAIKQAVEKSQLQPDVLLTSLWTDTPPKEVTLATRRQKKRHYWSGALITLGVVSAMIWLPPVLDGDSANETTSNAVDDTDTSNGASDSTEAISVANEDIQPDTAITPYAQVFDRADELIEQDQLISPAQNNALAFYRQVLKEQPDNSRALAGEQTIFERLINQAVRLINLNQLEEAGEELEQIETLYGNRSEISSLRQQLASALARHQQNEKREVIAQLLQQAQQAASDDQWLQPTDNSALYYYQQVLAIDSEDFIAQAGINTVIDRLLQQANTAIVASQFEQASATLNQARQINPDYSPIQNTQELLLSTQDKQRTEQERVAKEMQLQQQIQQLSDRVNDWIKSPINEDPLQESAVLLNETESLLSQAPNNAQLIGLQGSINTHLQSLEYLSEKNDAKRFRFNTF